MYVCTCTVHVCMFITVHVQYMYVHVCTLLTCGIVCARSLHDTREFVVNMADIGDFTRLLTGMDVLDSADQTTIEVARGKDVISAHGQRSMSTAPSLCSISPVFTVNKQSVRVKKVHVRTHGRITFRNVTVSYRVAAEEKVPCEHAFRDIVSGK